MNAYITKNGTLVVEPTNTAEEYILTMWSKNYNSGDKSSKLVVKTQTKDEGYYG